MTQESYNTALNRIVKMLNTIPTKVEEVQITIKYLKNFLKVLPKTGVNGVSIEIQEKNKEYIDFALGTLGYGNEDDFDRVVRVIDMTDYFVDKLEISFRIDSSV